MLRDRLVRQILPAIPIKLSRYGDFLLRSKVSRHGVGQADTFVTTDVSKGKFHALNDAPTDLIVVRHVERT